MPQIINSAKRAFELAAKGSFGGVVAVREDTPTGRGNGKIIGLRKATLWDGLSVAFSKEKKALQRQSAGIALMQLLRKEWPHLANGPYVNNIQTVRTVIKDTKGTEHDVTTNEAGLQDVSRKYYSESHATLFNAFIFPALVKRGFINVNPDQSVSEVKPQSKIKVNQLKLAIAAVNRHRTNESGGNLKVEWQYSHTGDSAAIGRNLDAIEVKRLNRDEFTRVGVNDNGATGWVPMREQIKLTVDRTDPTTNVGCLVIGQFSTITTRDEEVVPTEFPPSFTQSNEVYNASGILQKQGQPKVWTLRARSQEDIVAGTAQYECVNNENDEVAIDVRAFSLKEIAQCPRNLILHHTAGALEGGRTIWQVVTYPGKTGPDGNVLQRWMVTSFDKKGRPVHQPHFNGDGTYSPSTKGKNDWYSMPTHCPYTFISRDDNASVRAANREEAASGRVQQKVRFNEDVSDDALLEKIDAAKEKANNVKHDSKATWITNSRQYPMVGRHDTVNTKEPHYHSTSYSLIEKTKARLEGGLRTARRQVEKLDKEIDELRAAGQPVTGHIRQELAKWRGIEAKLQHAVNRGLHGKRRRSGYESARPIIKGVGGATIRAMEHAAHQGIYEGDITITRTKPDPIDPNNNPRLPFTPNVFQFENWKDLELSDFRPTKVRRDLIALAKQVKTVVKKTESDVLAQWDLDNRHTNPDNPQTVVHTSRRLNTGEPPVVSEEVELDVEAMQEVQTLIGGALNGIEDRPEAVKPIQVVHARSILLMRRVETLMDEIQEQEALAQSAKTRVLAAHDETGAPISNPDANYRKDYRELVNAVANIKGAIAKARLLTGELTKTIDLYEKNSPDQFEFRAAPKAIMLFLVQEAQKLPELQEFISHMEDQIAGAQNLPFDYQFDGEEEVDGEPARLVADDLISTVTEEVDGEPVTTFGPPSARSSYASIHTGVRPVNLEPNDFDVDEPWEGDEEVMEMNPLGSLAVADERRQSREILESASSDESDYENVGHELAQAAKGALISKSLATLDSGKGTSIATGSTLERADSFVTLVSESELAAEQEAGSLEARQTDLDGVNPGTVIQ